MCDASHIPSTCEATDNGGTDEDGDGCESYTHNCSGDWDDADFSVNEMCCHCSGGGDREMATYSYTNCSDEHIINF